MHGGGHGGDVQAPAPERGGLVAGTGWQVAGSGWRAEAGWRAGVGVGRRPHASREPAYMSSIRFL